MFPVQWPLSSDDSQFQFQDHVILDRNLLGCDDLCGTIDLALFISDFIVRESVTPTHQSLSSKFFVNHISSNHPPPSSVSST